MIRSEYFFFPSVEARNPRLVQRVSPIVFFLITYIDDHLERERERDPFACPFLGEEAIKGGRNEEEKVKEAVNRTWKGARGRKLSRVHDASPSIHPVLALFYE